MNKLAYKIGTGIATAALVASSLAPAVFADNTVTIDHNGAGSTNDGTIIVVEEVGVAQANFAKVKNDINQESNTGSNKANNNTGGNVNIDTGNATASSSSSTSGNSNTATVTPTSSGTNTINISKNGVGSTNTASITLGNLRACLQANFAKVKNKVTQKSKTGNNTASGNTGGNTTIDTGSATTTSTTTTSGNSNSCSL